MVPRKASERPFDAKTTAALLPILSKRRIRKDELQTILDLATKRLTSDEVLDLACAEEAVSTAARWFLVWRVLAEKLPREVSTGVTGRASRAPREEREAHIKMLSRSVRELSPGASCRARKPARRRWLPL